METNPKSFRKEHLEIRNAMSEKEVAEKSGVIVKRLLQTGWYQNAQEIFAYYPLKNEVDCRALFLQAWSDGKKIALPRTREENQMDFYYIDDFMQLKEGAFHVMEPMENCVRAVRTNSRSLFREACLAGTAAVMDMERVIMTAFLQKIRS